MQTEFQFTLPKGYVDELGQLHQQGRMRLATALDEIEPMGDPRTAVNPSYLPVLLLSRVVTQLGTLTAVTPHVIGRLFAADLIYLQELYLHYNSPAQIGVAAMCPHCQQQLEVQVAA